SNPGPPGHPPGRSVAKAGAQRPQRGREHPLRIHMHRPRRACGRLVGIPAHTARGNRNAEAVGDRLRGSLERVTVNEASVAGPCSHDVIDHPATSLAILELEWQATARLLTA